MFKRLAILGAIALAFGVSARYIFPTPAVADFSPNQEPAPTVVQTGERSIRWTPVWTRPAPELTDMAIAPNGSHLAWVDHEGSVRRLDTQTQRTLWQTNPLLGVNDVEIAPQGTVVAFSRLNPAKPVLRILDPVLGERKSALLPLEGAIWSVAVTPDGKQAVVGTGRSYLYSVPLRRDVVFPGTPIVLPGIPETVDVATDRLAVPSGSPAKSGSSSVVFLSTWQSGGVCAWGLDKSPRWRQEERQPDFNYQVTLSQDGGTAVAIASRGPRRKDARLHVWDARSGKLLWIENLNGFAAKAAVSATGETIAVTFSRRVPQGGGTATENKLAVFNRHGQRFFEDKGGVFFTPELVCVSTDGRFITVRDPRGDFWTLDNRGRTIARLTHDNQAAPIVRVLPSRDGKHLLVYHTDGTLRFYRATSV